MQDRSHGLPRKESPGGVGPRASFDAAGVQRMTPEMPGAGGAQHDPPPSGRRQPRKHPLLQATARITVYCTPAAKREVERRARGARISLSAYLLERGLSSDHDAPVSGAVARALAIELRALRTAAQQEGLRPLAEQAAALFDQVLTVLEPDSPPRGEDA